MSRSWPSAALGEVCDVQIGKTPARSESAFWGGDHVWLSIADMNQGRALATSAEGVTDKAVRDLKLRSVDPGTVLLSFKLSIGKVGIAQCPMFTNEAIAHLPITDPRLDRDYLYWTLKTIPLTGGADRAAMGATLNKSKLKQIEIPLPPLEEQKRIAAILDAADNLRTKRRQALTKLETLTQAVFHDIFGNTNRAPILKSRPSDGSNSWQPLADLAEMGTGHTPARDVDEYWHGDISWINLNEIRSYDGEICAQTEARITAAGVANSSAVVHPQGTVAFSRTASIGFVTMMGSPMATSQDFVTWTCGDELEPEYLMACLRLSRESLRAGASGSIHKTIYVRDAERFHILRADKKKQAQFAAASRQARREVAPQLQQSESLDNLFSSLQQRAFRGEL